MQIDLDQLLRTISNAGRRAVGLPVRIDTEDRRLLERTILPAFAARDDIRRVLFVGCAPYTRQYQQIFRNADYWTIDPAPSRARYGGKRHIVAPLQALDRHAPAGIFDLIVCNGVLGWGLNAVGDAERAFECCEKGLRVGGELIVGWNDVPGRNAVRPEKIGALRNFERHPCSAVGAVRMIVAGRHRHVFDFYRKRSRPAVGARSRSAAEEQEASAVASSGPGK